MAKPTLALLAFTVLVAAAGCGSGRTAQTRLCAPPRGPGDNAVHSTNLRVTNITCAAGRAVALACRRFTYGRSGSCAAAGSQWRCTSTSPPGSESAERCLGGRKSMRIRWLD
jgi:hypothetical protein